jgi:hypothetical protein
MMMMMMMTTGIRSEKCVVRRFRRCPDVIEFAYTNLDSIAYAIWYSLLLLGYKPVQHHNNVTNLISRYYVVTFMVLWFRELFPFILMAMYLGVSCLYLHVLLNHIAALVLCSFSLVFLYLYIGCACWTLVNLIFCWRCIIMYHNNVTNLILRVS